MSRRAIPLVRIVVLVLPLFTFAGCGPNLGTVTGKVNFAGKPLPGGMVTMYDAAGTTYGGRIKPDGTYLAANIPPGPAKVTVATADQLPGGSVRNPTAIKDPWGPYVQIPKKYSDPSKSGLQLDVKTGNQDYNIDLKEEWAEGEKAP